MSNQLLAEVPATQPSSTSAATVPATQASSSRALIANEIGPNTPITATIHVAADGSMTVLADQPDPRFPPSTLVATPGYNGSLQWRIDNTDYGFVNGVAFAPWPVATAFPSQTLIIPWHNFNDGATEVAFQYVLVVVSLIDGSVRMLDPTVENDPPGHD